MRECRLLLILTGGTIGTAVSETGKRTLLQVGDGQEPLILQRLRQERPDLSIRAKLRIPYQVLSEHMTVEHWERLLDCLREEELQAYDVVAITHGSDTLAYTAAFLDEALRGCPVPVFLVASQRPPEDPESNAIENFKATVETAMGLTAMTAQADASVLRSGESRYRTAVSRKGVWCISPTEIPTASCTCIGDGNSGSVRRVPMIFSVKA